MNKKMPGVPEAATTEEKARAFLESILWPNGPVCGHCKSQDVYRMVPKAGSRKPGRAGLLRCRDCRKQFTVTVGTIFEGSHIPLNKWLMAVHFMTASKKGISAHQLHRMLGVTYKAAWFMSHRLRYAMSHQTMRKLRGVVEVDETYVGGKQENRPLKVRREGITPRKTPVLALVQRDGKVLSFPIRNASSANLQDAIMQNVARQTKLITDSHYGYTGLGKAFDEGHHTVNHKRFQYVRPGNVHTNTVECFFSLLKRGIIGTFHHISKQHVAQYCSEFAFRWNYKLSSDFERALAAIRSTKGVRLMYSESQAQGAF